MNVVLLLLVGTFTICDSRRSYLGDKLYLIEPQTKQDVTLLDRLRKSHSAETGIDFWTSVNPGVKNVTVHVTQSMIQGFEKILRGSKIKFEAMNKNLEQMVLMENPKRGGRAVNFLDEYLRYDEIISQLVEFLIKCGANCNIKSIGKTHENRDINMFRIGRNPFNPYVWIDCGIHAREWISPATCLYLINKLVNDYGSDTRVTNLRESYNFFIVPSLNPDGYEYSHKNNRWWRKNRNPSGVCTGVDLNRNFGYEWGGSGTSGSSCSDIYRGPRAFSEPEADAVKKFVTPIASQTRVFLTIHSYGQYWLLPYGYQINTYPDNYDDMLAKANVAERAARKINGRSYEVGQGANILYAAAGSSDDWGRSIGIPYSYCLELPDTGRHGFNLPASYIPSVGAEIYEAIATLLENVK